MVGVFFRKYTKRQAQLLQVNGWVRNSDRGTVEGMVCGKVEAVEQMY